MYALPGVMLLVIFIYGRPQEFDERFEDIPFLYLWLALACIGMGLDLGMGRTRFKATPHLRSAMFVYFWCVLTLAIRNSSELSAGFAQISVTFTLFFLIAHCTDTFKGFHKLVGTVLAMGLFVSTVAVHQGLFSPWSCIAMVRVGLGRPESGTPDGRPCETYRDCRENAPNPDPDIDYLCERVGLFKTTTITGGRVRWRGVLQDPNEVALTTGIVLPFSFAFFEQKRSFPRLILVIYSLITIATGIILSQSRGGQLVFSMVLFVYFVNKYGIRGLIMGAVFAMPLMMLGGRGSAEAEESADERTEILAEGIKIYKQFPLMGCGFNQFTQHNWLTAHNAYLLAIAELGPLGWVAWVSLLYLTLKISLTALRRYKYGAQFASIRAWALAMLSSFCGAMIGIFFLSFTYHYVLWINFGLAGAFYCAVKGLDPNFTVKLTRRDIVLLLFAGVGVLTFLTFYTRHKGYY